MLAYPIILEDDDRTVLATSPGFPELTTFGEDRDEAISRAADATSFNLSTFFRLSKKCWPSKIGWPKALKLRRQSSFSKVVSGVIARQEPMCQRAVRHFAHAIVPTEWPLPPALVQVYLDLH